MQIVVVQTWIAAPQERCFDAARDLDLHVTSLSHTNEQAVGGRTSGLIELGEEGTWRGRHFGVYQHFTSRITAFESPNYFQDTMQRGAFKSFVHDHFFSAGVAGGTTMKDVLRFSAPFGVLGRIAETLLLRVTSLSHTWRSRSRAASKQRRRGAAIHVWTTTANEQAVSGRTSGLIELGEEVTWRARHFGVYQHFTSKITAFERPEYFQDTMQRGAFKSFVHDHFFSVGVEGGTTMKDVVEFSAPLGVIGRVAEKLVLRAYLERLLTARAAVIKNVLERTA